MREKYICLNCNYVFYSEFPQSAHDHPIIKCPSCFNENQTRIKRFDSWLVEKLEFLTELLKIIISGKIKDLVKEETKKKTRKKKE